MNSSLDRKYPIRIPFPYPVGGPRPAARRSGSGSCSENRQVAKGVSAGCGLGGPVGQDDRRRRRGGSRSASRGSRARGPASRSPRPPRPSRTRRRPGTPRPARRPRARTAAITSRYGSAGLTITMSAPSATSSATSRSASRPFGRVLLVGHPVAGQRRLDRLAERPVERGGVLRRVRQERNVRVAGARPAPRGPRRPGRPSSRTGPSTCAPARACATRHLGVHARASRRCRPSRPAPSTPQCPCEVNSSRHRSLMTTVASPTSATTSRIATLRMPSGSTAAEPTSSRVDGTPNSISPPTPACDRLDGGLAQRVPGVLHDARASTRSAAARVSPSRTNIGSTSCAGWTRVSATSRRMARRPPQPPRPDLQGKDIDRTS